MSGVCFKGIRYSETLTLHIETQITLKHRLFRKLCQTAANREHHVKYPAHTTLRVLTEK